jgi:rhamnosyltransferase
MQDLAIGIVLYCPDEGVIKKINIINELGLEVFIFDNSPINKLSFDSVKVHYLGNDKNPGLGVGLKKITSIAHDKGFDSMLYFDQDTLFSEETIKFVLKILQRNPQIKSSFSAISITENGPLYKSSSDIEETMLIRNSGTIFFLDNLKKINWFDTSFFVDGVDYEFCLRSKLHKFKIGIIGPAPGFDHVSEQGYSDYNILSKSLIGREYEFNRLIDASYSSLRIFVKALKNLQIIFAFRVIKLLFIFLMMQLIFRISTKKE